MGEEAPDERDRVVTDGRFLAAAGSPFRVRGVTYGSFESRIDGTRFPDPARLKQDLVDIHAAGLNTVRTYDLPPPEMVEMAEEIGLRLLVGLSFADWRMESAAGRRATRRVLDAGRRAVDEAMARCAGRDVVLAVAVSNEVPDDLVRLHGPGRVADVLAELVADVHAADRQMLATYVSYPTTEYLTVEGCDLFCLNVFLESAEPFRRYLRHLQVASGGLPVLLTEVGFSSEVLGERAQAALFDDQLRLVDECGCAGALVFAWTDEWAVGDEPVEGWGFGITTEDRLPKLAFEVVERWATADVPRALRASWPRVSAVVCAYNEERTIEECVQSLLACGYPDLEVLVCDDGSTDRTAELAERLGARVLRLPHGGLSAARNAGLAAASGEIVAYLDADAAAHPEWPYHLVLAMEDGRGAAGGPNLPCRGVGIIERAIALSPGNPREVLLTDDRAEHVAGCNMAYRKRTLESVGGFDPVYTAAGDDVDVCWKVLDGGDAIAFSPAAQVRHHRRASIRGYLRQQRGYGRAERILAGAHPHRFNRLGQAGWAGVIYGGSRLLPRVLRPVVYHGHMGEALFKPVVRRPAESTHDSAAAFLPLALPFAMTGLALTLEWPLAWALVAAALVSVLAYGAAIAAMTDVDRDESRPLALRTLVGMLHIVQPFARLWGRLTGGRQVRGGSAPVTSTEPAWRGDRLEWLHHLARELKCNGCTVRPSGPMQVWDLAVSVSVLVRARVTTAVAWQWEPRHRIRYAPRSTWWVVAVPAVILAVTARPLGTVALAAVLIGTLGEIALLHRRLKRALEHTTEGAYS